jgi:hypothetical protein
MAGRTSVAGCAGDAATAGVSMLLGGKPNVMLPGGHEIEPWMFMIMATKVAISSRHANVRMTTGQMRRRRLATRRS